MAILTAEQKTKYLDGGAGACPFCGDSDISGGQIQIEGAEACKAPDSVRYFRIHRGPRR